MLSKFAPGRRKAILLEFLIPLFNSREGDGKPNFVKRNTYDQNFKKYEEQKLFHSLEKEGHLSFLLTG